LFSLGSIALRIFIRSFGNTTPGMFLTSYDQYFVWGALLIKLRGLFKLALFSLGTLALRIFIRGFGNTIPGIF
jgi:hypothetical protein